MKYTIEVDNLQEYLEKAKAISEQLNEIEDKAEALNEQLKFLKLSEVADLMGLSIPATRALFHRPNFPCCNYGKEMVVQKKAFLDYFSKPVLRGDDE